ncbi:MAG: hypothetical protein HW374_1050 [Bacteroidetes bacterium]|nr:hypothetical protein [Bacteroidota bacterium]
MGQKGEYSYSASVKSAVSDELINTYLLRPVAGLIVRLLYRTPVTPNQVTVASTVAGLCAALFYLGGTSGSIAAAGLLVTLKDVLDSADGQLARARNQYTRIGRFLDSIGDFVVDLAVFSAIGWVLYKSSGEPVMLLFAFLGFVGITLRVSYHVFYHTSFLHQEDKYKINRVTEELREEDRAAGALTIELQEIFQALYGWQDKMMLKIDHWCRKGMEGDDFLARWYSDIPALRFSGFLGFGTELFLLMLCSIFNELELYLYLNVFLMNGILLLSVAYRRAFLWEKLRSV